MPASTLEARIARLHREIEELSAEHAEKMAKRAAWSCVRVRELDARRANMLARRVHELGEMLKKLRHQGV